jgi:hypothetical protein
MSSSGTKKAKKTTGSPAKGKKPTAAKKPGKRKSGTWVADLGLESGAPEVQAAPIEAIQPAAGATPEPTMDAAAEPTPEPKPAKPRRSARAATSGATDATPAAKPLSCLDAAAAVLADRGVPMRCKDLIDLMASASLWSSTAPTPAATLYSAILREIATKGEKSRFKKTDRGHFALNQ